MSERARAAALIVSLEEQRALRAKLRAAEQQAADLGQRTEGAVLALTESIERARAEARGAIAAAVEPMQQQVGALAERLGTLAAGVEGMPAAWAVRLEILRTELRQAVEAEADQRWQADEAERAAAAQDLGRVAADLAGELEAIRAAADAAGAELTGQHEALVEGLRELHAELAGVRGLIPEPVPAGAIEAAARQAVEDIAPTLRGAPGRPGLVWRGAWVRRVEYEPDDVVGHMGSSWVALRAVIGLEPGYSDAWDLVARAGTDGGGGFRAAASPAPAPDAPAADFFEVTAAQPIAAGQVAVVDAAGRAVLASSGIADHAGRIVAIARASAAGGAAVRLSRVATQDGGWSFQPGRTVYLGLAGELTQDNTAGLFQQELGVALTANRVLFQPGLCIVRN